MFNIILSFLIGFCIGIIGMTFLIEKIIIDVVSNISISIFEGEEDDNSDI